MPLLIFLKFPAICCPGKIDRSAWQAIDIARRFANINYHTNQDINLMIDVEPDEASLLIWLTETLFEEFYISRHEKDLKLEKLKSLAQNKVGKLHF